jgi:formylglycine-generating enzyme required for sulfatase activity
VGLVSEAALWNRVRSAGAAADIDAFMRLFPESRFTGDARSRRDELVAGGSPAVEPRPPDANPRPLPAPAVPAVLADARPEMPESSAGSSASSPSPVGTAAPPPPAAAPPAQVAIASPPALPPSGARGPKEDDQLIRDCPHCPVLVRIPGGGFMMGAESGDASAAPRHRVTIRPFAIGKFPVTVAEWKACLEASGCRGMPRMAVTDDRTPLHDASWDDAQQFITWLSTSTKRKYRLPTEAEWEYAARANTSTRYWWGNEIGVALANCTDCGGSQDNRAPLPVGSFKPNPFGLFDTLGGVAQWVQDCWAPNYQGAPSDGSAREQKSCTKRVLRGGSFRNDRTMISTTARNNYDASVRYITNGFRVARELD